MPRPDWSGVLIGSTVGFAVPSPWDCAALERRHGRERSSCLSSVMISTDLQSIYGPNLRVGHVSGFQVKRRIISVEQYNARDTKL